MFFASGNTDNSTAFLQISPDILTASNRDSFIFQKFLFSHKNFSAVQHSGNTISRNHLKIFRLKEWQC